MNKFQNAVGRKLSSATTEAMTDQSLLPSLDNHHTKKYNNCDNFMWHKTHPLSGAKFSRGAATLRLTPTAIISDFSFRILKNTIKSLFLPILAIMLSLNLAYADDPQPTQAKESELEKLEKEIFVNSNDFAVKTACEPSCRAVSDKYIALITDFNPLNGITNCSVFQKDLDYSNAMAFNANTLHTYCTSNIQTKIIAKNEELEKNTPEKFIDFEKNDESNLKNKITTSNIFGGIFTLDPKFIDIQNTQTSGNLSYTSEVATVVDNSVGFLDTGNLGIFVNGFANIEKLYRKLLNWLLVFIGAYFLFTIFADMVNSKLEKKDYHFKVLNGFLIPVAVFAVFFMPIQQSDNMHSTIFQKLTRYFVQEGIKIADLANLHLQNAYLKSIFDNFNIAKKEQMYDLELTLLSVDTQRQYAYNARRECINAFEPIKTFQLNSSKEKQYLSRDFITKQEQINKNRIYTFEGCQNIERRLLLLEKIQKETKAKLNSIKANDAKILNNLKEYNKLLNTTVVDKGFISSMAMPSTQLFIGQFLENEDTLSNANKNVSINLEKEKQQNSVSDEIHIAQLPNALTGNLAYLVLPGATGVFNTLLKEGDVFSLSSIATKSAKIGGKFIGNNLSSKIKNSSFIKSVGSKLGHFKSLPIIGGIIELGTSVIRVEVALKAVSVLYDMILDNLPILTASVAAVIAFLAYVVTLFKFYYLSPVMLMYAVTSKRKDKINDFLVTGIVVFLKPLLIVVFLFLAVIFYNFLQDLFMLQNIEQFLLMAGIKGSNFGGITNDITMSVLQVLMKILSCIAAMYIMFQLIYYGPDRLLKLIGVNNGDDGLISGLHGSVSKHMTGGL